MATSVRIGVPLVPGTDPLTLGILERIAAQIDAELALLGDARRITITRLAPATGTVPLWGGARLAADGLLRDRSGIDVLVLLGAAVPEAVPATVEEEVLAFARAVRGDAQHIIATGGGILWAMRAGLTAGRRVVVDQLPPRERARFDATLPAQSDPARDGDLWTASDPPRFALLLLEFAAELGGFRLADRVLVRLPWLQPLISAFASPPHRGAPRHDDGPDDADGDDPHAPPDGGADDGVAAVGGHPA